MGKQQSGLVSGFATARTFGGDIRVIDNAERIFFIAHAVRSLKIASQALQDFAIFGDEFENSIRLRLQRNMVKACREPIGTFVAQSRRRRIVSRIHERFGESALNDIGLAGEGQK